MRSIITAIAAGGVAVTAVGVAVATGAAPGAAGCAATIPQPALGRLAQLPLAAESARADLCVPSFSTPTRITNPLFPIGRLRSALLVGRVDGKVFRTETTLLPHPTTIEWNGRRVEALESQYVAYLGGRLHEVAVDRYAQADDGSVWYLGEDVFNYEAGVVADTDGTWEAGREGPAAMIMPARPEVGTAFRPENAPGVVFEEVVVERVGARVAGPRGAVDGAIVTRELHQDGTTERKLFAPGYGEFLTGSGGDLEAIALAVPTDSLPGPVPAALTSIERAADGAIDAAGARDWPAASQRLGELQAAWRAAHRGAPPRIAAEMTRTLRALDAAVGGHRARAAQLASLDVARSGLDLQLRHRPPAEIDRARFDLWARQVQIDAAAGDVAGVRAGAATLGWITDRFAHTMPAGTARALDAQMRYLQAAAAAKELGEAGGAAARARMALGRG